MEAVTAIIKNLLQNVRTVLVLGVILGLALGLIIGWGLWPVTYTDTTPEHLSADLSALHNGRHRSGALAEQAQQIQSPCANKDQHDQRHQNHPCAQSASRIGRHGRRSGANRSQCWRLDCSCKLLK